MASSLTPEEINNSTNYKLIKELSHESIIEFVIAQLKELRWPIVFFYGFNSVLFGLIAFFTTGNFFYSCISWELYWKYLFAGVFAGMILVIPVHEVLHGLAYRLGGAPKVKFGADFKQMLFYASAPSFIADKKTFYLVAFSPFVLINIIFFSGILFGSTAIQWGSLVAVFMHSTMCVGDFAMVNYFSAFPGNDVYTYDDSYEKRSYFFIKQ